MITIWKEKSKNGMNAGDKLECKLSCSLSSMNFTKNKIYIISKVFIDKKIALNGVIFSTPENRGNSNSKYVYDYFYTKEEIRNLKLDSL